MQHLGVGEEQGEVVNHNLEAGVLYLVLGEGAEEAEEAEEVKMMDILKKKKKCRKMIWIKELDFKLP